ncbi:MAG: hypothetical protein AAF152_01760 [Cyanobacteria bacterium P01_A01_bin.114]
MAYGVSILGFLLAVCLALVHVFASRSRWLASIPHRWWISLAGGISIAYIFLDVFPELSKAQAEVEHNGGLLVDYLENHAYLLALAGLAIFYGLEKLAVRSRRHNQKMAGDNSTQPGIFWVHIFSFSIYNAVLGYLFRESADHGLLACLLLFIALALHFIVNDVGLREHHKQIYDRLGRWILAAAIFFGWAVGEVVHFNAAAVAAIWALVAGGIILNVMKEELPENQESHFGLFLTGAVIYSAILLVA